MSLGALGCKGGRLRGPAQTGEVREGVDTKQSKKKGTKSCPLADYAKASRKNPPLGDGHLPLTANRTKKEAKNKKKGPGGRATDRTPCQQCQRDPFLGCPER